MIRNWVCFVGVRFILLVSLAHRRVVLQTRTVRPLHSAEKPDLSVVLSFKPGVSRSNVALHVSLAARYSASVFFAFPIHLIFFL